MGRSMLRPYKDKTFYLRDFAGGDGCGGGFLVGGVGFEFFVGAFEVFDVAGSEVPDSRGDFFDDVFVVADEEDGAFEFCSEIFRALMDSRSKLFVGSSKTRKFGFLQHQFAEEQASGFASA